MAMLSGSRSKRRGRDEKVRVRFWDYETKAWVTTEGLFHQWGMNYREFESGAGNFSVGIVELPGGRIVLPGADDVCFLEEVKE